MPVPKRLSAAEAARFRDLDGRRCAACGIVYPHDEAPDKFAADRRTSDGYSRLCLDCLALRDNEAARRANESKREYADRLRASIRAAREARTRALLDAQLPEHGVPLFPLPQYPSPTTPPRTPAQDAILTRLYNRLRESAPAGAITWEQISREGSRTRLIAALGLGVRSLDQINEHLAAFDLPPLKP